MRDILTMVIEPPLAQQASKEEVRLAQQPASLIETRRATQVCDIDKRIVYYDADIIFIRLSSCGCGNTNRTTKVEEATQKGRTRSRSQRGQ